MSFPISTIDQMTAHLRALRKARGLTQADLGLLVGVSQNRIADIERNPGAVSMAQMHKVLAALGGQLVLQDTGSGWAMKHLELGAPPAKSLGGSALSQTSRQIDPIAGKVLGASNARIDGRIQDRGGKGNSPLPQTPKSRDKGSW